jgi:flagellin-specific chaperone FliS
MRTIYVEAIRILNVLLYAKNRNNQESIAECNRHFKLLLEKWRDALTSRP